ncbi:hypothetical protein FOXG_22146 [Fusarium oxysporum f. sp. lycopersici 4287]|uniref:Class II aldolase/adducin N-terminal domain-containing protein n=1 Tax=Fusarium oxysporum f. sp. lycopersici (strain 4287 / CBS 123668 / FGSC 9935 / NRRL 34936) TaxID=426428 RepID=A0A0J9W5B2_FUSO4|nr:hypothetical protein FOXG_22146 [Fusarium oxysporum f. sp. lycopersici 4287]KNB18219.1 hypothetical protein FOXG_22146 [Fusarium oxysporum f. sp. lycopersici 4287]
MAASNSGMGISLGQDFGGVFVTQEEGGKIGAALGMFGDSYVRPKGKAMILQNYGLLTTGATVGGTCFLMTLVERASQCQLLVEAAAAQRHPQGPHSDASAKYIFGNSSDLETLHWEGQPDLEYEEHRCKGEHKL